MGKTVNSGSQDLSLQIPSCIHHSTALHELLHALGFAHEQTRPDRDTYVRVNYANIESGSSRQRERHSVIRISRDALHSLGHAHNFDKYSSSQVNTFNEAYDYGTAPIHFPHLHR